MIHTSQTLHFGVWVCQHVTKQKLGDIFFKHHLHLDATCIHADPHSKFHHFLWCMFVGQKQISTSTLFQTADCTLRYVSLADKTSPWDTWQRIIIPKHFDWRAELTWCLQGHPPPERHGSLLAGDMEEGYREDREGEYSMSKCVRDGWMWVSPALKELTVNVQ